MYTFNWALTAFRSESYIASATALPDIVRVATEVTLAHHMEKAGDNTSDVDCVTYTTASFIDSVLCQ